MSTTRLYGGMRLRREVRKRVPLQIPGGSVTGWTSALDGYEWVTFDVYLDGAGLEALALKAAHNKSGRSVAGPLEVRVTKRKREVPRP